MSLLDPAPPVRPVQHVLPHADVLTSLQALSRLVGPVEALRAWQAAASDTGHHGTALSDQQLLEVAAALQRVPGVVGLYGTSLAARVRARRVLARTHAGAR